LKVNHLGIVGGILAFVSLLLPWWTMSGGQYTTVASVMLPDFSGQAYVFLFHAMAIVTTDGTPFSEPVLMNLWFGWTALALVFISGLLALAGSLTKRTQRRRILLALGGILIISSIIVFPVGMQNQISDGTWALGFPTEPDIGLFSIGTHKLNAFKSENYLSYLSFGFWLALVAGVMMFIALRRRSDRATSLLPQSSPTPVSSR
jgi:hypothetical protein